MLVFEHDFGRYSSPVHTELPKDSACGFPRLIFQEGRATVVHIVHRLANAKVCHRGRHRWDVPFPSTTLPGGRREAASVFGGTKRVSGA